MGHLYTQSSSREFALPQWVIPQFCGSSHTDVKITVFSPSVHVPSTSHLVNLWVTSFSLLGVALKKMVWFFPLFICLSCPVMHYTACYIYFGSSKCIIMGHVRLQLLLNVLLGFFLCFWTFYILLPCFLLFFASRFFSLISYLCSYCQVHG